MNIKINLLPTVKKKKKKGVTDTTMIIIIIFFLVALGLTYFTYWNKVNILKSQLSSLNSEIERYKDMERLKNEKLSTDKKLNYYISTTKKLINEEVKFSVFFEELSAYFPKYAYLTSLDVDKDSKLIRMTGVTDNYYTLGKLLFHLKQFPQFSDVFLSNFGKQGGRGATPEGAEKITFTIMAKWKIGGKK